MTHAFDPVGRTSRRTLPWIVWALLGAGLSIAIGMSLGYANPISDLVVMAVTAGALLGVTLVWPFAAFRTVVVTAVFLVVWVVAFGYSLNAFDALLPSLIALWLLSRERADAGARTGLLVASDRLVRSVLWYFAAAAASLLLIARGPGMAAAIDSGIVLIRGFQGALIFAIARWSIRTESDARRTTSALLFGGVALATVSAAALMTKSVARASSTWFVNEPLWSMGGPNEAAAAMVLLWVVLIARQMARPQARNVVMLGVVLVVLVLTQSRSGLLAWVAFNALWLRRAHWRRVVLGLVVIGLAIPLVPGSYWERMARTVILERGSFEAFSSLIRVFGWQAALKMFLDHPIFGVGYLGFRFLSAEYNSLGAILLTAENLFLETATGMGIIGLGLLAWVIANLYKLGRAARATAPSGSLGAAMARVHGPFVTASLVGNLTGDNWVGLVGVAQIALWCALLVSSAEGSARSGATTHPLLGDRPGL